MNLALHNWTHALATVKTWQLKKFPVLRDNLGEVFIWSTSYVASKLHLFPEYDWDHQVVSASYWNIKKIFSCEWLNMECYSTIKGNELLMQTAIWMNLKEIM